MEKVLGKKGGDPTSVNAIAVDDFNAFGKTPADSLTAGLSDALKRRREVEDRSTQPLERRSNILNAVNKGVLEVNKTPDGKAILLDNCSLPNAQTFNQRILFKSISEDMNGSASTLARLEVHTYSPKFVGESDYIGKSFFDPKCGVNTNTNTKNTNT